MLSSLAPMWRPKAKLTCSVYLGAIGEYAIRRNWLSNGLPGYGSLHSINPIIVLTRTFGSSTQTLKNRRLPRPQPRLRIPLRHFLHLKPEPKPVPNRYLLPCSCGQTKPVSTSQAGDRFQCACGLEIEVPPLRQILKLEPENGTELESSTWGFREGVLSCGIIISLLLALGGGFIAWSQPAPPSAFDPSAHTALVEANIDQLSAIQTWDLWVRGYKPLAASGFSPMQRVGEESLLSTIETYRSYRNGLFMSAGVVLLGTLVTASLLPSGATERS